MSVSTLIVEATLFPALDVSEEIYSSGILPEIISILPFKLHISQPSSQSPQITNHLESQPWDLVGGTMITILTILTISSGKKDTLQATDATSLIPDFNLRVGRGATPKDPTTRSTEANIHGLSHGTTATTPTQVVHTLPALITLPRISILSIKTSW